MALYRRYDPAGLAARQGVRRHTPALYGVRCGPQPRVEYACMHVLPVAPLLLAPCASSSLVLSLSCRQLPTEADGHGQLDRHSRYFAPSQQRAERNPRLKRWRRPQPEPLAPQQGGDTGLLGWRRPAPLPPVAASSGWQQQQLGYPQGLMRGMAMELPSPSFMPLKVEEAGSGTGAVRQQQQQQYQQYQGPDATEAPAAATTEAVETNEAAVLRRTREFNAALRERPHDVALWLKFARFQVCVHVYWRW